MSEAELYDAWRQARADAMNEGDHPIPQTYEEAGLLSES